MLKGLKYQFSKQRIENVSKQSISFQTQAKRKAMAHGETCSSINRHVLGNSFIIHIDKAMVLALCVPQL
jgi:hypothetical protein